MFSLLFYRASAGSGKTHILVIHYVKLALKYPDAFKHILAVTFTNSAAQEMKQRILMYLYNLANNLSIGELSILKDELYKEGWDVVQIQERSKQVLSLILNHYEDFSVTTLDSFFYKVVQSFFQEFGLQNNFVIEMDQESVLEEVVGVLMNQLYNMPLLQQWMIEFSLHKLCVGRSWNIEKDVKNFGKEIFSECFKIYEEEILPIIQQESKLQNFVKKLQDVLVEFETNMQAIGKSALCFLDKEHMSFQDFAYGHKGVLGYFLKLANKKAFKPTKRAVLAKNNLKSWLGKNTNVNESVLIRGITDTLLPLLVQGIDLYKKEGQRYNTALLIVQNIYLLGIVGALLTLLNQYKIDNNIVFISDITWLLYQHIRSCETPFFYENISNQYQHLLIDEFQDLSMFQWSNIKPLIQNSVSQGYACLLVGDIKQSIYRWRGSYGRYLMQQVRSEFPACALYTLTINRRSREIIVLFNNHVLKKAFNILIEGLTLETSDLKEDIKYLLKHEINQIQEAYSDIVQDSMFHALQEKGSVELVLFKAKDGEHDHDELYIDKELVQLVEKLKQEGIPAEDIVFLVRNNEQVNYISNLLTNQLENHNIYPIISDGERYLWKNPAVNILIYALYYLLDDNNPIYVIALVQAYMGYIEHESVLFHNYVYKDAVGAKNHIETLLPKNFLQQKNRLKHLSIYACVQELITIFFETTYNDSIELAFFQSVVLDCFSKEHGSIALFLDWWEKKSKKIKLPVSHSRGVMRVMTIHQAKGLEFKVVIIPFCNWNLDHSPQNSPILWVKTQNEAPFGDFPILPLRYINTLKDSYYAQDYFLEHMECCLDNFNLLYVAFTRATDHLYLFMPMPKSFHSMQTVADLVYQSVVDQKGVFDHRYQSKMCVKVEELSTKTVFVFH